MGDVKWSIVPYTWSAAGWEIALQNCAQRSLLSSVNEENSHLKDQAFSLAQNDLGLYSPVCDDSGEVPSLTVHLTRAAYFPRTPCFAHNGHRLRFKIACSECRARNRFARFPGK
jgi:hypothetical protein